MSVAIHMYANRVFHEFCWVIQHRLDEILLKPLLKLLKADFHRYNFDRDVFDIYKNGIVIACISPEYVEDIEYPEY